MSFCTGADYLCVAMMMTVTITVSHIQCEIPSLLIGKGHRDAESLVFLSQFIETFLFECSCSKLTVCVFGSNSRAGTT